jgi:hypothetical protein
LRRDSAAWVLLAGVWLEGFVVGCHKASDSSSSRGSSSSGTASSSGSGAVSGGRQGQQAPVLIQKQPVVFASHTFDPAAPPPQMPPLPPGEAAECDSNFMCRANVGGQPRRTDATHATLTITQVMLRLQLEINIWLPNGYTQTVAEHEQGHRQISEYYYQTADKLAERIAASYIGKRVEVTGTDLDAESSKMLLQVASEITNEYTKEINANPTQLLYDTITDHARNGVVAREAVDHALKNAAIEATQPTTNPGN